MSFAFNDAQDGDRALVQLSGCLAASGGYVEKLYINYSNDVEWPLGSS